MITLFLLALSAQVPNQAYKELAPGDRIEVTFRNGNTLTGTLLAPDKGKGGGTDSRDGRAAVTVMFFADSPTAAKSPQADALEKWAKERKLKARIFGGPPDRELWARLGVVAVPSVVFEHPDGRSKSFPGGPDPKMLDDAYSEFRAATEGSSVDYSKETALMLDISLEYPGLNGTMTIPKDHLRSIRKLQKLDEATLKRLQDEKQRIREANAKADAERRERDTKRTQDALSAADAAEQKRRDDAANADELKAQMQKIERLEEGKKVLDRFPPPEWGPEKAAQIGNKSRNKLPVSQDELDFLRSFDLWTEAFNYMKEKEKKEDKTEQPKSEK